MLRQQRTLVADEHRRSGRTLERGDLVFPSAAGTPLHRRNVQRSFHAALQRAGLPDIRFHDLRHTAGTLRMREDGRVVVAQQRLGHAKANTTLDIYGHALPGDPRGGGQGCLPPFGAHGPAPRIGGSSGDGAPVPKGSRTVAKHQTMEGGPRIIPGAALKALRLSTFRGGRGWFRTSDLSDVNCFRLLRT